MNKEKERSKDFPLKNPNPVFQAKGGRALFLNPAARRFLGIKEGNKLPVKLNSVASVALKSGKIRRTEYKKGRTTYCFTFKPLKKQQCVNIYGFNLTDHKKKEETIREANIQLLALNQQLSATEQQLRASELEVRENINKLSERNKELKALYRIALIIVNCPDSTEKMLSRIVKVLPGSLQYPGQACARITLLTGEKYKTENFRKSAHMLHIPIKKRNREYGKIEVGYLRLRKDTGKSPFLNEEKKLMADISERIGKTLNRLEAAKELHQAYQQLMASNQQLRATDQQLRASNQQLRATEQQLRASNSALAESEKKYRSVVELMPDIIIRTDREGNYLDIITSSDEKLAAPKDKVIGKNISDVFSKEDAAKIKKTIKKALDGGKLETIEYDVNTFAGHLFFEARIIPVNKDETMTLIRDITERKLAEEEMEKMASLNKLIFNISSSFIPARSETVNEKIEGMLEKSGKFFNVDRAYLFRFSPGGTEMHNAHEWCADGVEPLKEFFRNIQTDRLSWCNKKINEEDFLHIPDVNKLPAEAEADRKILKKQRVKSLLCVPIRDKNANVTSFIGFDAVQSKKSWGEGEIYLLKVLSNIIADTFESIEAERRIIQAQKLESIGRLAGGVAHEINNPLGSILAAAQLMLEETDREKPFYEDLKIIEKSAKRCDAIVKRLLEFSRKGTGEMEKINLN